MTTAPLILGVPAAAHREALLRETAGGGRVPKLLLHGDPLRLWTGGKPSGERLAALILHHPTDPEASAMGLARLAWVAEPGAWWSVRDKGVWWEVMLDHADPAKCRAWTVSGSRSPGCPMAGEPAAIGFVARVHLGLLERVDVPGVGDGG